MTHTTRIPRSQAFMEIAKTFAKRSTCLRGQVGCVAVVNNHIVSQGYNGAPKGMPHCLDVGCGGGVRPGGNALHDWVFPNGCTRSIHAEANMVAFAASVGASLDGCTVYSTAGPCLPCAQLLVAVGMAKLEYLEPYRLPEGLQLVKDAGIDVAHYEDWPHAK